MTVRTYDRETYLRMQRAWADFGPEWTSARQLCALAGYPFPPSGSPTDDRDDTEPSQRAIVYRALDFRPLRTLDTIRTSRSWSEVVRKILAEEGRLREDATWRARDDDWERAAEIGPREAVLTVGSILERVRESLP